MIEIILEWICMPASEAVRIFSVVFPVAAVATLGVAGIVERLKEGRK